jgi:hypothetical protein
LKSLLACCRAEANRAMLILFVICTASSCTDKGTEPDEGLLSDHSTIADPAKRWEAYGVDDYALLQMRTCFCGDGGKKFLITVRDGNIVSVVDPIEGTTIPDDRWWEFKTIAGLFDLVNSIDTSKVASLQVSYDVKYGYPLKVFVDQSANIIDEEYGYETELVKKEGIKR